MLVVLPTQEYDELSPIRYSGATNLDNRDRDSLRNRDGVFGMYAEEEYESDISDVAESGEDESQSSRGVAMATMTAKGGSAKDPVPQSSKGVAMATVAAKDHGSGKVPAPQSSRGGATATMAAKDGSGARATVSAKDGSGARATVATKDHGSGEVPAPQSSRGGATATMAANGGSAKNATRTPYNKIVVGSATKAAAPRDDRANRTIASDDASDTDDGDDSDSNDYQSDVMSDHQEEDIGGSNEIAVAAQSNRTKKRKSESETSTTAQSEKALKSKKKKNSFEKLSSGKPPAYGSRSKVQLPPHNPSDHSDYYGKGRKV